MVFINAKPRRRRWRERRKGKAQLESLAVWQRGRRSGWIWRIFPGVEDDKGQGWPDTAG